MSLVQPLFDGPLDVVGDVHGEIDALRALLGRLGYGPDGRHPGGRRLVFVGDLTDRGPDSPAVVALVGPLIERGLAQGVLGNHELNLLQGLHKEGNSWFYGETEEMGRPPRVIPQAPADESIRRATLELFRRLPIALERPDLRVVHAAWDPAAIKRVRPHADAARLAAELQEAVTADLDRHPPADAIERKLALQNRDPVKVLVSGPERRVDLAFWSHGKWRNEERVRWWEAYPADQPFCACGHYWRIRLPEEADEGEHLFDPARPFAPLGPGRVLCIDYSVGKRWRERVRPGFDGPYRTRLAALRWPERVLVFDDGEQAPVG